MKRLLFFILLLSASFGWSFEPFVKYLTKDLSNIACYPSDAARGMVHPGEKPSFVLHLRNTSGKDLALRAEIRVRDYENKPFAALSPLSIRIPAGKTIKKQFRVPASKEPNHYILHIDLFSGTKKIARVQSAFTCVLPFEGKRDPFFGLDKYGVRGSMVKAYERLGAGSVGICFGRNTNQDPDVVIPRRRRSRDWQSLLNSDLNVVGALWPIVYRNKRVAQRVKAGLPALCDEEVEHYRRYVRRLVMELKDKVKVWLVMSEYDAAFQTPAFTYFSSTAVLANQVLLTRIAYREIKKIQPEAKVAVLGMMGIDYYHAKPKFRITRFILDDLKKDFDLLCIDAYNGNWHSLRGPLNLPENDFRNFLKDTADLSASYGRPRTVINAENGYSYDFRLAYDAKILHQIARYTARRLIINRSVPCMFSFWHKASHPSVAVRLDNDSTKWKSPVRDMATLWKTINSGEAKRRYVEIPLLPGAAYATTSRMLAFAKFSKEIRLDNDIYCYTFTDGKNRSLAAVWCIYDPVYLKLDLPGSAVKTDMVGRKTTLPGGRNSLLLSQEPVYITLEEPVEKLNKALMQSQTFLQTPVTAAGYKISSNSCIIFVSNREDVSRKITLTLPERSLTVELKPRQTRQFRMPFRKGNKCFLTTQDGRKQSVKISTRAIRVKRISDPVFDGTGKWFTSASQGRLGVPDNIFPKRALLPEWGYFQWNKKDISAEYALGYDSKNLYLGVKVKDLIHQQRFSDRNIWRDDSLQIAFTSRYGVPLGLRNGMNQSMRVLQDRVSRPGRKVDYIVLQALSGKGPRLFSNCTGLPRNKALPWRSKVTRKGSYTIYELAIPLKDLKFRTRKGSALRFNFLIHDNNRRQDSASRYFLSFAKDGTYGVKDISCYETLILE